MMAFAKFAQTGIARHQKPQAKPGIYDIVYIPASFEQRCSRQRKVRDKIIGQLTCF
jgi:hypothetical protein